MKIFWFIFILVIACSSAMRAQQIYRHVLASGGGEATQSDIHVNLTLGQVFIGPGEVSDLNAGIGFWYSLSNIITNLEHLGTDIQEGITLYQNTPNPFKENSFIKFTIPEKMDIHLELLNEMGHVKALLIDAILIRGTYRANIDGSELSPGVYFYRLTTRGKSWTKKCIVIN